MLDDGAPYGDVTADATSVRANRLELELCRKVGCAPQTCINSGGRFHPRALSIDLVADERFGGQPTDRSFVTKPVSGRLSDPLGRYVSQV